MSFVSPNEDDQSTEQHAMRWRREFRSQEVGSSVVPFSPSAPFRSRLRMKPILGLEAALYFTLLLSSRGS